MAMSILETSDPTAERNRTRSGGELLAQMGAPLDPAAYDWSAATRTPLRAEEEFQLVYAAHVEWATEGTFESLDISTDPVVGEFLQVWLAQEVVHAELLTRFLSERGREVEPLHRRPEHRRGARRGRQLNRVAHRLIGDDFFGVHMMWGAVNELCTLRFYRLIRRNTDNELLREILRDVIAQESLHYAFYLAQARERLEGNPRAQRIVRFALEHLWSLVGVGLRSREDADRLLVGLLVDEAEQVRQIDASIRRMPGLERLELLARSVERARRSRPLAPVARPQG